MALKDSLRILFLSAFVASGVICAPKEKGCGNNPADLIFVLDESGSIWGPHFTKQLEFVQDVIDSFDVGLNKTHVGVLTFGTNNRIIFPLGKFNNEVELKAAIKSITQKRGETYTHLALKRMREEMFSPQYARSWVRHVAIVITDGESNYPRETEREAILVHQDKIQTLAIGVGPAVVRKELEAIASAPDLVFTVSDYGALESLRTILAWKACEPPTTEPPLTTTPTTTTTTTEPPPQMIEGCNGHNKMDHVWAIPDEAGIEETSHALDFIRSMTEDMTIDPLHVQVGLTPKFCSEGGGIRLKDHDTKEGFWRDLDRRRLTGARIDRQFEYIRTQGISSSNGGRSDAVKFGIVIVDNRAESFEKASNEAKLAKENGIRLMIIGVGEDINQDELRKLASSSDDFFYTSSYVALADLKSRLIQRICQGIMGPNIQSRFFFDRYFD